MQVIKNNILLWEEFIDPNSVSIKKEKDEEEGDILNMFRNINIE